MKEIDLKFVRVESLLKKALIQLGKKTAEEEEAEEEQRAAYDRKTAEQAGYRIKVEKPVEWDQDEGLPSSKEVRDVDQDYFDG